MLIPNLNTLNPRRYSQNFFRRYSLDVVRAPTIDIVQFAGPNGTIWLLKILVSSCGLKQDGIVSSRRHI